MKHFRRKADEERDEVVLRMKDRLGYSKDCKETYIDGFCQGADWAVCRLWHLCNEKPEEGRQVLTKGVNGYLIAGPRHDKWDELTREMEVAGWCYCNEIGD